MKKNFLALLILLSTNVLHATENEEMKGKTSSKQKTVSFSKDFLSFDELLNERNTLKKKLKETKKELKKVSREKTELSKDLSYAQWINKLLWNDFEQIIQKLNKQQQAIDQLALKNLEMNREIQERINTSNITWQYIQKTIKENAHLLEMYQNLTSRIQQTKSKI